MFTREERRRGRLAGAVLTSCLAASVTVGADRPQWGEAWSRNMTSPERGLPESFDPKTGRNVKWAARLGTETHSTPVIARGRVYIGTNNGTPRDARNQGDRGVLMCFDERTGAFLWQFAAPKIKTSMFWDWPNAGICSPATVEEDRVYLISNRGEVVCLDAHGMTNGNDGPYRDEATHCVPPGDAPLEPGQTDADILWLFDMVKTCGVRQHDSAHGSILIHGPFLYVNTSNGVDDTHKRIQAPDAPSLIVLDKRTGRLVARDDEHIGPRIFHSTWSSPALAEVNGRPLILFCGGDGVVYAFEPVKADLAQPPRSRRREEAPSSKAEFDQSLLSSAATSRDGSGPGGTNVALLKKVWWFDCDPTAPKENVHRFNSNRRESPSNVKSIPVFHGNRVFVTVGGDLWWGKHQTWLQCIDATKTGDITKSGQVWSCELAQHCMGTPAVQDGLVFVGDSGHRLHCIDAATGTPHWTHDVKGEVWASPLVADGKVYFATRRGEFLVFAASKEKKLLSELDLGSPVSGTPVAANGVLYVTTMRQLYAVQQAAR
ncbi:MAG: PQQ-binding-like beta-propeller repeat protein [Verrucomicrobia bacterium]|nr:PQQ-binding-like beta-propeller repeat protein [Verrucomicrobiota bacterium]